MKRPAQRFFCPPPQAHQATADEAKRSLDRQKELEQLAKEKLEKAKSEKQPCGKSLSMPQSPVEKQNRSKGQTP